MSDPLICCICPAHREEYLDRAIKSYRCQSYIPRRLLILDNAKEHLYDRNSWSDSILHVPIPEINGSSVGALRNCANRMASLYELDILAHFDMDDWSAPDRLSTQLAHIQKTGKLVTGFYDMPMYDVKNDKVWMYRDQAKRYILGASLFYRREAWERVKFPDKTPEDNLWRKWVGAENCEPRSSLREDGTPIMIQTIHGGNASARIVPSNRTKFQEADEKLEKAVREILARA